MIELTPSIKFHATTMDWEILRATINHAITSLERVIGLNSQDLNGNINIIRTDCNKSFYLVSMKYSLLNNFSSSSILNFLSS